MGSAMNYATFNEDGTLKHRLIEGVHDIPAGAVEIADGALWVRLISETDGVWVIDGAGNISKKASAGADPYMAIAAARYDREMAGLKISGMLIDTSDRSKTLINGSALKALRDPNYVLRWKTESGFIDLSSTQVMEIADAVSDFVQACFDREDELQAAVMGGFYTASMLAEGWPE